MTGPVTPTSATPKPPVSVDAARASFGAWGMPSPYSQDSLGSMLGRGFSNITHLPDWWHKVMSYGPGPGALLGAGAGVPIGYLGSKLWNYFAAPNQQLDSGRTAMLGAVLGAGAGGLQGYLHNKSGAFGGAADVVGGIQQSNLDSGMKMQMMAMVPSLPPDDLFTLQRIVGTAGGAMLGALLTRFFFGRGIGRSAVGAALGGFLGFNAPTHDIGSAYG